MKQIDKYVLRQLVGPFLFFYVIFAGIIWLNQALLIIDVVVKNGQSGAVFVELSLYLLPKVSETVMPIAAFASAIYLTNRLYAESELVVMMSVGRSPAQATLPYIIFGGACFVLMTILTQFITPASMTALQDRQHELSKEYLSQFIVQGEFSTVISGVTIFFGETTPDGRLTDILINDRRDANNIVTHTANAGHIIAAEDAPKLVLFKGSIQQYRPETRTLSTVQFDSLSYDLSQFAHKVQKRRLMVRELGTLDLLWPATNSSAAALPEATRVIEAHTRLVKSLLAIIVPMIGAIILISSGYNRSGFFFRISLGVLFMVGINSIRGLVQGWVLLEINLWPVLYAPVFLSAIAGWMLIRSGSANWKPRKQRNRLTKVLGR